MASSLFSWFKLPKFKKVAETDNPIRPTRDSRGGRRGAQFEDLPTKIGGDKAYDLIYERDLTYAQLNRRARKCGGFSMVAVGGAEERRKKVQEALDGTVGLPNILEHLSYADVEGVRFAWLRVTPSKKYNVINFEGCGGRKIKAGGEWFWGGPDSPDVARYAQQIGAGEDASYDRKRVLIFHPTSDVNPDGDTHAGLGLYRIATVCAILDKGEYVYTERFALPKEIIEIVMKDYDPSMVQTALSGAIGAVKAATFMDMFGMSPDEAMKLLEPSGKTWEFLQELRQGLRSRAKELVTGEGYLGGSGDKGSSELDEKQFFSACSHLMKKAAEEFTNILLPFLCEVNKAEIPAEGPDDPPMWIEFRPPVEKHRLSVQELLQAIDRGIPVLWEEIYSVLGLSMPPGIVEKYGPYYDASVVSPEAVRAMAKDVPSNTGETAQRSDRKQKDSNMEPEPKQDKVNDVRNTGNKQD